MFVVSEDGRLYAWGQNTDGNLGTGDFNERHIPTQVWGFSDHWGPVRQVAAGDDHTGIVTDAGHLFMCGANGKGQLGLGDWMQRDTPTLVPRTAFGGEAILMVACGSEFTVAVTEGGAIYSFGCRNYGKSGHIDDRLAANQEGEVVLGRVLPLRVPQASFNEERIVMVGAYMNHCVALSEQGHVFTWGFGLYGQLGHGNTNDQWAPLRVPPEQFGNEKVAFVDAGANVSAAVTACGRLYTWGANYDGELGIGDVQMRWVPVLCWQFRGGGVVMVSCGTDHTMVVVKNGDLYASGEWENGQLGIGEESNDGRFTRVRRLGGRIFEDENGSYHEAEAEEAGRPRVLAVSAGSFDSVAVTEDGRVWIWGLINMAPVNNLIMNVSCNVPRDIPSVRFDYQRIGRCRVLPEKHTLAFASGMHDRLGQESVLRRIVGDVPQMIAGWSAIVLPGIAGRREGLMRLVGGYYAWRARKLSSGH